MKRAERLENENVGLRVGSKALRDAEAKLKRAQEENAALNQKLKESEKRERDTKGRVS